MNTTDSLQLKTKSTMQAWLGLLAPGVQSKEILSDGPAQAKPSSLSPTSRKFNILRQNDKNKCIVSTDGTASFCLHKVNVPHQNNQYEWDISDSQGDFADGLVLKHGNPGCVAAIERKDGSVLATLHQGGFYTLNRFRWGSKRYRWTISGCPDPRSSLQIKLMEDGSKQELARFSGPGTKCKSYWIQNPDFAQDTITMFGRTDYPTWMQVVVASGLVAAKTQRRIDKSLQRSR